MLPLGGGNETMRVPCSPSVSLRNVSTVHGVLFELKKWCRIYKQCWFTLLKAPQAQIPIITKSRRSTVYPQPQVNGVLCTPCCSLMTHSAGWMLGSIVSSWEIIPPEVTVTLCLTACVRNQKALPGLYSIHTFICLFASDYFYVPFLRGSVFTLSGLFPSWLRSSPALLQYLT